MKCVQAFVIMAFMVASSARSAPRGAEDLADVTTGLGGALLGLAVAGAVALAEPSEPAWAAVVGGLAGAGAGAGVALWPAGPISTPWGAAAGGALGGLAAGFGLWPVCDGRPGCRATIGTAAVLGSACGAALGAMLTRKPRRRYAGLRLSGLGVAGAF